MGQRSLLYRTGKNCYVSMIFPQVDELVGSGIVPLSGLRTVVELLKPIRAILQPALEKTLTKLIRAPQKTGDKNHSQHKQRY